jgi:chromosome segregation ATPase
MFNQAIKLAADKGKLEAMLSQAQQYNKALEEDVRTMTEKTQELEESLVSSARRAHTASSSSSSARRAHTQQRAAWRSPSTCGVPPARRSGRSRC